MTTIPRKSYYDVIVVGARCAGAATAMLLARKGASVLLVDRAPYGSDTLSTHALLRGGVERLDAWGLSSRLRSLGAPRIEKTTFEYAGRANEVAIRARGGVDALYAPRRHLLDAMLVDEARASGAEVHHGHVFRDVVYDVAGRVSGVRLLDRLGIERIVRSGFVVGADGLRSSVARAVGAKTVLEGDHAATFLYVYVEGLDVDGYRWIWEEGATAGFVPTNDGLTNVFVGLPRGAKDGFVEALGRAAPRHLERVLGARMHGPVHRHEGAPGRIREAFGPGWALVGDAGASRDPITSHGMSDALRDAELLADALASGEEAALATYEAERDVRSIDVLWLGDRIASFAWSLDEVERLHRALSTAMNESRIGASSRSPLRRSAS